MTTPRSRAVASAAAVAALLAVAADSTSSTAIRPEPGAPDPRKMVLTSRDLGRNVKVTAQGYYKDETFPSVVSYAREFENGRKGLVRLPYVDSHAEVGVSAAVSSITFTGARKHLGTERGRRSVKESLKDELPSGADAAKVRVGKPRDLGVGEESFDVLATLTYFGRRMEFHLTVFRVDRVLGLVGVAGEPGKRVPLTTIRQLAEVMATRTRSELRPRNVTPPVVTGAAAVGQRLAASAGVWTGNPAQLAYQWQRCDPAGAACSDVAGAASQDYVVTAADSGSILRVAVTATNSAGRATAISAPTARVPAAGVPVSTAPPTIIGTPRVGELLTAGAGSWTDEPTSFGFQWQRCDASAANCADITGAVASTYLVSTSDVGSTIRVVVAATTAFGSTSAASQPTSPVT